MSYINLTGQVVGIIPLVLAYFMFSFEDRRKILGFKTASDLLWVLHFFLLGEVTGIIVNLINTVRNIVFSQNHRRWCRYIFWPVFFCMVTMVCTAFSGEGLKSVFPAVGSCLAVIGFWCKSPRNIRRFNLPAVILWLIYGIIIVSIPTIVCNLLSIISIIRVKNVE